MDLQKVLKQYDYQLPAALIAQKPSRPRDAARLLVFGLRDKKTKFDTFKNLGRHLPKNAVLVFNQTKVWPARLEVIKPTGGKARLLYISHDDKFIKMLSDRPLPVNNFVELCRTYEKIQQLKVIKKSKQFYYLKPSFPISQILSVLKTYGLTPLPPYIKNSPLTEKQRREQYQTVFAKTGLSVAAPTASLHFTKELIKSLGRQGIDIRFIRLDVGLGTFTPLRDDNLKTGKLHREFYSIDNKTAAFLDNAKKQGRPIIAVGTTTLRTLESAFKNHRQVGQEPALQGNTDLFIQSGYKFNFIDGLITNFHVPKSSLLMLVSALTGREKILELYEKAIKKRFRFFSFGDGMVILP